MNIRENNLYLIIIATLGLIAYGIFLFQKSVTFQKTSILIYLSFIISIAQIYRILTISPAIGLFFIPSQTYSLFLTLQLFIYVVITVYIIFRVSYDKNPNQEKRFLYISLIPVALFFITDITKVLITITKSITNTSTLITLLKNWGIVLISLIIIIFIIYKIKNREETKDCIHSQMLLSFLITTSFIIITQINTERRYLTGFLFEIVVLKLFLIYILGILIALHFKFNIQTNKIIKSGATALFITLYILNILINLLGNYSCAWGGCTTAHQQVLVMILLALIILLIAFITYSARIFKKEINTKEQKAFRTILIISFIIFFINIIASFLTGW